MIRTRRTSHRLVVGVGLLAVIAAVVGTSPAAAAELPDDAALLWDDATVLASIDDHKRLIISDVTGTLSLRPAKDGELRYAARTLDNRRDPWPVSLWSNGSALYLRAIEGSAAREILLEVAVSPELAVVVEIDGSIIQVGGRSGDLAVRGSGLDIDVRNMTGNIELALRDSTLAVEGAVAIELEGSGVEGRLANVAGDVDVTLSDSTIAVRKGGALRADVSDSSLLVEEIAGEVTIDARDSGLAVGGLARGGVLRLIGSPATVAKCDGVLEVETDDAFEFRELKGGLGLLHTGFESSVRGSDSPGAVVIDMQAGEITLSKIGGAVQIQGSDLRATLTGLTGDLTMATEASQIQASDLEGKATIHNTLGDVQIKGSKQPIEIINSGGTVRAEEIGGSLQIWGDGEFVEAEWATIAIDTRGHLENSSGGVIARLPTSARCKVEAETSYGTIESTVPGLEPDGDGKRLSGSIARGQGGTITIKAAGDVSLSHRGG